VRTSVRARGIVVCGLIAGGTVAGACSRDALAANPSRLVERSRLALGSELRLGAWTAH
jgi:hypothetical protein